MRKYFVTVDDDGKEIKRTLTTYHEEEDYDTMSLEELTEVYYEATAEFSSKARKIKLLEELISKRHHKGEYLELNELTQNEIDRTLIEASNNILDAQEEIIK